MASPAYATVVPEIGVTEVWMMGCRPENTDNNPRCPSKQGPDHDFSAFGQCAISIEVNHNSKVGSHLLFRCWHLKDMAWQEDEAGKVEAKFRKWKPTLHTLRRTFKKIPAQLEHRHTMAPFDEHEVCLIEMELRTGLDHVVDLRILLAAVAQQARG